jgi:hypothetical protein
VFVPSSLIEVIILWSKFVAVLHFGYEFSQGQSITSFESALVLRCDLERTMSAVVMGRSGHSAWFHTRWVYRAHWQVRLYIIHDKSIKGRALPT